ncbi:pilus assembly protein PilP [Candidatus Endoriftia persephone]|uniref:Pilus assembly protein PilP n=3 Tax=Gammaproteobacteria TaxID=1236 RepID=G2FIA9_9GAMM|nr:pilus assembly protein PilP [Candidatus Endoriftia persephone]EGV52888.1 type IV pilus biogenesis protein PilP [endosymbiont of Riftia pachyptila (vent Ph05)]EGW53462.1 pilus assembly protein PilP [endosymbiont of Tevnia jerichonana (vent Tica)]USF87596.1 pilus assembly protein PilP [Candidatus Endoriftia persephone]
MMLSSPTMRSKWWFVLVPLFMMAGCTESRVDDLERFVADTKSATPPRIDPLPEVQQIDTFLYESGGRRDPFSSEVQQTEIDRVTVDDGVSPNFNRRKEELEHFPLDSIRMVGTLEQDGTTWGLVQTPEGTIHRVRAGNYMGRNHGRVTVISEEKIDLTEIVQDGLGGYRERLASLALTE